MFALQAVFAFGQKASNNLTGTFKNKSLWSSYSTLEFDGKGKVTLNGKSKYEFFERNDSIFVMYEDGSLLFSKVNGNQLKGLNKKVKKVTMTSTDNAFTYGAKVAGADKRLDLVQEYYLVNYVESDKLFARKGKGMFLDSMKQTKEANQKLCDLDLDLGCVQVFVYSLTDISLNVLTGISEAKGVKDIEKNKKLEDLGYKIIKLGNPEGYALLFSYYTLIDENVKAKELNEKGLKEGCVICVSNVDRY